MESPTYIVGIIFLTQNLDSLRETVYTPECELQKPEVKSLTGGKIADMLETVKAISSPMLTLKEAATALRLTVETLREPVWLARLDARKVGRHWLVPADKLTEVLSGGSQ